MPWSTPLCRVNGGRPWRGRALGSGGRAWVRAAAVRAEGGSSGARESGVPGACARTAFAWARPGGGVNGEQRAAGARVGVRRAAVGRARGGGGPAGPGVLRDRSGVQGRRVRGRRARLGTVGRSRGRGERRGPGARGREERKERERGEEREKKRKEKENGKKKRKEKEGREKGKKGERERLAVIPPVATATPVGHARLSRPRPAVRHDARVEEKQGSEYGCRVSGESGDLAEQGRSRKTGVRVSRRDLELNDEAKF